jgi:hypothetical protein
MRRVEKDKMKADRWGGILGLPSNEIERALCSCSRLLHDMEKIHRRGNISVPRQILHSSDVDARLKQVCGEINGDGKTAAQ